MNRKRPFVIDFHAHIGPSRMFKGVRTPKSIVELMDSLGLQQANVLGNSMGGLIGIEMAAVISCASSRGIPSRTMA